MAPPDDEQKRERDQRALKGSKTSREEPDSSASERRVTPMRARRRRAGSGRSCEKKETGPSP